MAEWNSILIAVDEMESSLRAVKYVARLTSILDTVKICLLHVFPEPPPDYHIRGGILEEYEEKHTTWANTVFSRGIQILVKAGVERERIFCTTHMTEGKTISETVLEVRRKGNFGTVVTGKRGVSKSEEFLFGSISNTLARRCQDFTIWIVG